MFSKCIDLVLLITLVLHQAIPIQLDLQEGEEIKQNNVDNSDLNQCISVQRSTELGFCFGKDLLNKLNNFNEADSFSLASGVDFVRDEKIPRDFGSFLDKDPMDFRAIMEDASNLISKRSLHWDLSGVYPGLTMKIGPTLSNGVLEFVLDPRIKDRTYNQQQSHGELSTGRLLARNLLVPFLLGFKFQLSTLLPLVLGLVLIASKKAFLLAKVALLAATVFGGSGFGSSFGGSPGYSDVSGPALSSYTSYDNPGIFHGHGSHSPHGHGGFFSHSRPHHHDYYYKEKSSSVAEQTTASPITPDELRDRLERLFVTKKEIDTSAREDGKVRAVRNFAWTPINAG